MIRKDVPHLHTSRTILVSVVREAALLIRPFPTKADLVPAEKENGSLGCGIICISKNKEANDREKKVKRLAIVT